jgi:hypothetical protein
MRTAEIVVRVVLGTLMAILVLMVGTSVESGGGKPQLIILSMVATLCLLLAFGRVLKVVSAATSTASLAFGLLFGAAFVILHFNLIPYCGDGSCTSGECDRGCGDCTPQLCQNGRCQPPIESCANTEDCVCLAGFACSPGRNTSLKQSDPRGCFFTECGDDVCDATERDGTCCMDCGCQEGFVCRRNICYLEPPKLNAKFYRVADGVSATSLAGNPALPNKDGVPTPLAAVTLRPDRYIRNITVTFSLLEARETFRLGQLRPGEEGSVLWYLQDGKSFLKVVDDTSANFTIIVMYADSAGNNRASQWQLPFTVMSRNTLDEYGSILLYVTDDIGTGQRTPQGIWDELRSGFTVTADTDRVQFPLETRYKRRGSARDVALLLASAFDNAGLRPALIEGPGGRELLVRVQSASGTAVLDPALFARPFSEALTTKQGTYYHDLRAERQQRNYTVLALEKRLVPDAVIAASTAMSQSCVCAPCVQQATAVHTIHNDGLVRVNACAVSRVYDATGVLDAREQCFTLEPTSSILYPHAVEVPQCGDVKANITLTIG